MQRFSLRMMLLGMTVTMAAIIGCGPPPDAQPISVSGVVKLDNQPMKQGKIFFFAEGHSPTEGEVKDGSYSTTAYPGTNKVQLGVYKAGKAPPGMPGTAAAEVNILPTKYHSQTILKADVKDGGENKFDFEAHSK